MNKKMLKFEKPFTDGIYAIPSNNKKKYNWRLMIEEVKKKGRALTEKEADKFLRRTLPL